MYIQFTVIRFNVFELHHTAQYLPKTEKKNIQFIKIFGNNII